MVRLKALGANIVDLVGLQGRLFQADSREWRASLLVTGFFMALGIAAVIGGMPVLIYCLAVIIQTSLEFSLLSSLALSAGTVMLLGLMAGGLAWQRFLQSFSVFDRSRVELSRNLAWLKGQIDDSEDNNSEGYDPDDYDPEVTDNSTEADLNARPRFPY
jgi:hypothetical protein